MLSITIWRARDIGIFMVQINATASSLLGRLSWMERVSLAL